MRALASERRARLQAVLILTASLFAAIALALSAYQLLIAMGFLVVAAAAMVPVDYVVPTGFDKKLFGTAPAKLASDSRLRELFDEANMSRVETAIWTRRVVFAAAAVLWTAGWLPAVG